MATQGKARGRAMQGQVLVVSTEAGNEAETEAKTEQETVGDEIIADVSASAGKAPESIVYRKDAETGEEKWLAKVATSLISHEWIAKRFGGGEYRVQHRKANATGKMVYGGQDTFKIDPSVKPEPMATVAVAADGTPVAPGSSRIDAIMEAGVMSLIQQMQNSNTTQMELVRSIVAERSNAKGTDWVAVLTALSPILAAIIPVLTNRPDPMTQAREIAELATKNQGAQGGLKDLMGALREVLEVRDILGGGGDDRSTGERLLESALPKFMDLAEKYAGNAPPAPVAPGPVVSAPAVHAALPSGQPQPSPQAQPMHWAVYVAKAVPRWVALAQRGKDPELYAEVEVDNMPPALMAKLRTFLQQEDAIETVFNAFPVLRENEEWSRDFFNTVTELVLPEEEDDGLEDEEDEDDGGEAGRQSESSGADAARGSVPDGGASVESGSSHEDRPARSRGARAGGRQGGADGGGEAPDASDATPHRRTRRGGAVE